MTSRSDSSAAYLVVVGSVAYDTITTANQKARPGLGGSATYFSAAASLLSELDLIAVVGEDFDLSEIDFMVNRGLDISSLERRDGLTFQWEGVYGPDYGDVQTLRTDLNVFEKFKPVLNEKQRGADFLFLGNILPSLQLDVLKQAPGAFTAVDTMDLWINTARDDLLEVLKRLQMVILNETEAYMLSGQKEIRAAAVAIQNIGPQTVVIKRGSKGSYLRYGTQEFICPATLAARVVDPTGCGDTFAGGLMGNLARRGCVDFDSLREGMILGNILAAKTLSHFSVEGLINVTLDGLLQEYRAFHKLCEIPALKD